MNDSSDSDHPATVTSPLTGRRFRRTRATDGRPRAHTAKRPNLTTSYELRQLQAVNAALIDDDIRTAMAERPRTLKDCPDTGPCPFAGCRHHLYLDVLQSGAVKINFPDLDGPLDIEEPCTLRLAQRGGLTLEDVGQRMNLTRERMRQIEVRALIQLKRRHPR